MNGAMGMTYQVGEGQVSVNRDLLERLLLLVGKCDRCNEAFTNDNRYYEHDAKEVLCFGCWY